MTYSTEFMTRRPENEARLPVSRIKPYIQGLIIKTQQKPIPATYNWILFYQTVSSDRNITFLFTVVAVNLFPFDSTPGLLLEEFIPHHVSQLCSLLYTRPSITSLQYIKCRTIQNFKCFQRYEISLFDLKVILFIFPTSFVLGNFYRIIFVICTP